MKMLITFYQLVLSVKILNKKKSKDISKRASKFCKVIVILK